MAMRTPAWCVLRAAAAALASGATWGCGASSPPPLRPEAFVRPPAIQGGVSGQTDQNGTLVYGDLHAPILPDAYTNPKPHEPVEISPVVRQAVAAGTQPAPADVPTTAPATTSAVGQVSTYQVVGTVVATVNGRPIYADKVLASIEPQLAADARRTNFQEFKGLALEKIQQRIQTIVQDLNDVAAANEFLGAEAKAQADAFGRYWVTEQITTAGGSREVAKERALRDGGKSLEEQAQDARDGYLVQLYLQQRVYPLIQVTPTDMRAYYEQHIAQFTQVAEAKFRLIKIDAARRGGIQEATRVADHAIQLLKTGQDFDKVAKEVGNDDPNGGVVAGGAWVQKGSYVNEDVENSVWKLRPTEFTDPPVRVARDNAFYIAVMDARKNGAVQTFEDVQAEIERTLKAQQLAVLVKKLREKLTQQSVVHPVEGGMEATLDMALQRYPQWVSAK